MEALIWDVDGTMAETEEVHREAFNHTFKEHGFEWEWSRSKYQDLLRVTGGVERITHFVRTERPGELPEDTMAVLTCSEGTDVFIHNETEVETALAETDVVYYLSELLATPGLDVRDCWSGSSILNTLREDGYLEDYGRDNTFAEYLVETINENFYDTEIVESSTEKYDHKRGFTTLTAVVQVPVANLIHNTPLLGGWDVSVKTPHGTLNLEQ